MKNLKTYFARAIGCYVDGFNIMLTTPTILAPRSGFGKEIRKEVVLIGTKTYRTDSRKGTQSLQP